VGGFNNFLLSGGGRVHIPTPLAPEMLYGAFFVGRGSQWLKRILVQCPSSNFCSWRDDVGKELNHKTVVLRSQLARLGGEVAPGRGRGDQYCGGRRFRRSIETGQGIHGQGGVQNPDG
jgi:hypothetical protein